MTVRPHADERIPIDRRTWDRFWRAFHQFSSSEVGWKAKALFVLLFVFLFAINALNVGSSFVARDFMTAIENRDRAEFLWQTTVYAGCFLALTAMAVLYRFTEERLALLWREWLTKRLFSRYLERRIYYRLEVSGEIANPDQRIADDTRALTVTTLSFVLMLVNAGFTIIAFSSVLWSISRLLFAAAVAYAVLGSLMTILLGRPLVWLNYDQLDREADLRSDLTHIRQNAESVALLRREGRHGARLLRDLEALTANLRHIIAVNRNLGFFTTGYNYMIQIIPAVLIAPLFIRGDVQFGVITQSAMAFSQLLGAFSLIITQFQSITSFAAVVARLSSLAEAVDAAKIEPAGIETVEGSDHVAYQHLTLCSPTDGRKLLNDLSASVQHGTRLLVRAQDTAAGVALMRATAGLWQTGEGCISRPHLDSLLFLPERPYLPPGTLRESLLRTGQEDEVADEVILAALRTLGLGDVPGRAGGLDVEKDWDDVLSLGEQQLLGVARLLLAAPPFVFLDRIGTALDSAQVERALEALSEHVVTYIVFKGDGEDLCHYDAILDLAADGTWTWTPLREAETAGASASAGNDAGPAENS